MTFEAWLHIATQDLPIHRLEAIRAELMGHYLDAVDDYLLQGLSVDNARAIALRELGDARAVCDGLRLVHIHRRDYWRAFWLACMPTACVILFLPAMGQIRNYRADFLEWIFIIFITITAILTIWATLNSLKMVSMIAYLGEEADLPISLIRIGLYALLPVTIFTTVNNKMVFMALINAPTFTYSNAISLDNGLVVIISILASVGLMLCGIGWILLATKITRLPHLILPLLRGLMFTLGMSIAFLGVGAILQDTRLTSIGTAISLIFGTLTFALFIILFYQMAKNTPPSRASYA